MSLTLPELLAHALAMEQEAADRYLELAKLMEAHLNGPVSSIFRDMHRFSLMHRDDIQAQVGDIELPKLRSSQYRWRRPPEVGGEEVFEYLVEPHRALRYARENELRAMQYYRSVATQAQDAELARLATQFADEEAGHVAALDNWIAQTPRPASAREDSDPMPPSGG